MAFGQRSHPFHTATRSQRQIFGAQFRLGRWTTRYAVSVCPEEVGMTEPSFRHHRQAALALLVNCPGLPHKAAGFLGHVCIAPVLSTKQREWLMKLLARHG